MLLSLLTVLVGFGLGGVLGAMEDGLKADLKARGEAVLNTVYAGDAARLSATVDKAWTYYKRAHLHGGAIGTAALACALLCAVMTRSPSWLRTALGVLLGLGGLGYSLFWLWAGYRAPALGSTAAAKASLEWLAVPSAGLTLFGLVGVLVLAVWEWCWPAETAAAG